MNTHIVFDFLYDNSNIQKKLSILKNSNINKIIMKNIENQHINLLCSIINLYTNIKHIKLIDIANDIDNDKLSDAFINKLMDIINQRSNIKSLVIQEHNFLIDTFIF